MTDVNNLNRLRAAYQNWHDTKGGNSNPWLDLMSDEVCVCNISEDAAGLSFAKDRNSKKEVVDYLTAILNEWSMIHWTCETFVDQGDKIAMFGRCGWTNKATGKSVDILVAHLWKFQNGEATEFTEIFDSAAAAAAATA